MTESGYQPHIIKEIRRSDDEPKIVTQAEQTQVVTPETATKPEDDAAAGRD